LLGIGPLSHIRLCCPRLLGLGLGSLLGLLLARPQRLSEQSRELGVLDLLLGRELGRVGAVPDGVRGEEQGASGEEGNCNVS
jgi:hypothetical protein